MSVALLPRYPIPGYEDVSPEEAAELLHQAKNKPEQPPDAALRHVVRPFASLRAAFDLILSRRASGDCPLPN